MKMNKSNNYKTVLFCFSQAKKLYLDIVNVFLKANFKVLVAGNIYELKRQTTHSFNGKLGGLPVYYECDFDKEVAVQDLQVRLLENHYPLDLVFTDFSQPEISRYSNDLSVAEMKEIVESDLTSYFHLLKCVYPLMNSEYGHLYHLTGDNLNKEKNDLGRMSNMMSYSIYDMFSKEYGDLEVIFRDFNQTMFDRLQVGNELDTAALSDSEGLINFLEKNSTPKH
ncbi:SDR family oxidoreductase [Algoriphagus halophytocola]|uniref:SDR family oxidoreductase n=1 Tax=Algoriphagus halophytocola TaxID=2991499 RepID=A0ABY6MGG4_9BACT|nr:MULTISPECIES: SDR family oxidoreductase [unclassified Algoriphagus]UZD22895.1 SDR family oxidoreductase [Algoriphagus sp. TR-M5]WBL44163.1 SDR family oxidoreductase [Algoriphagus sp. TR-M9]